MVAVQLSVKQWPVHIADAEIKADLLLQQLVYCLTLSQPRHNAEEMLEVFVIENCFGVQKSFFEQFLEMGSLLEDILKNLDFLRASIL